MLELVTKNDLNEAFDRLSLRLSIRLGAIVTAGAIMTAGVVALGILQRVH